MTATTLDLGEDEPPEIVSVPEHDARQVLEVLMRARARLQGATAGGETVTRFVNGPADDERLRTAELSPAQALEAMRETGKAILGVEHWLAAHLGRPQNTRLDPSASWRLAVEDRLPRASAARPAQRSSNARRSKQRTQGKEALSKALNLAEAARELIETSELSDENATLRSVCGLLERLSEQARTALKAADSGDPPANRRGALPAP